MGDLVYIVMKNGKPDKAFWSKVDAETHKANLTKKWSLAQVVEMEVSFL